MFVVHYKRNGKQRKYAMAHKLRWPNDARESAYACGMKRPHYPVPAINGPVMITPKSVIWFKAKREDD